MRRHTSNQIEGSTQQQGSSLPQWRMMPQCNNKRLKMTPPNTGGWTLEGGELRRWDEIPGDILVQIFNRLPIEDLCKLNTSVRVCRSWFLAALDVVIPPSIGILDLRVMCTLDEEQCRMYLVYLKLALDTRPKKQRTIFYHSCCVFFTSKFISYIAKRTPRLQHLVLPKITQHQFVNYIDKIHYWRKLVVLDISCRCNWTSCTFSRLAYYLKNLRSLSFSGSFNFENISNFIETLVPQLEYLSLQRSSFTMEAASLLIAEAGRGNNNRGIETLDLQHCLFFKQRIWRYNLAAPQTVQVKIHEKAAAVVKNYLCCEGIKLCTKCWECLSSAFPILSWEVNCPKDVRLAKLIPDL